MPTPPNDSDRRARPTTPPVASPSRGRAAASRGAHDEDPPPNVPPPPSAEAPARARARQPSIGRIALNAPPSPDVSPEDRVLLALAQTEQAIHLQAQAAEEAAEERQRLFEENLKAQIKHVVTTEVQRSVPPPPAEKSTWAHIGPQLPAIIAAVGAIVVSCAQSCAQTQEIAPRLDKIEKHQVASDARELSKWDAEYAYDYSARYWSQDVFEALDVQITDPLGAPDRKPETRLEFYPPPKLDPHKIQKGIAAPRVQPKTPFPLPPAAVLAKPALATASAPRASDDADP